jgi:hypothetical protein
MNNQLDISKLINEQVYKAVAEHVSTVDMRALVESAITNAVDSAVIKIAKKAAEDLLTERNLSNEIAALVTTEVKSQLDSQSRMAVKIAVGQIDTKKIISEAVTQQLSLNIKKYDFPESSIPHSSINWANAVFNGDMVTGGIIRSFQSTGIQDNATDCQLTIVDGVIVAEGHLISKAIQADSAKLKHVLVEGELKIAGSLSLGDEASRSISKIAQKAVDSNFKGTNIDIGEHSIISDKTSLLNKTTLGGSVTNSNLRRLGLLMDLRVSGDSQLADTMTVTQGHKVGINTDEPTGALSIWDDDAELTVQKTSRRNMYLGSTRPTDVSIGTNNRTQMRLGQEQIDILDPVSIMGIRFSVSNSVPEHEGFPQEIVMVRTARNGQPMFYICLGGNAWEALR